MKNSKRIICIHGYGKRRGRQFPLIEEAFSDRFEILCPDYYELDRKDASYELWLHNVQAFLDQYKDEPMILIGFSLGALIACHFESRYMVEKLILISPAFDYRRFEEVKRKEPDGIVPKEFIDEMKKTVDLCLKDLNKIQCPVVLIHARQDELIPYEASESCFKQIASKNKKLFLLEGGSHTLLDDPDKKEELIELLNKEV